MCIQGLLKVSSFITLFLSKTKQKISDACQVLAYSLLLSHLSFIPYVHADPMGGVVIGGTGSINQSGLTTTIDQTSSRMAINWDSYNIAADERVQYNQSSVSDISLNLILSNTGSEIHGQIDALGQVILVNTNGILFSETSTLNVGGLIASGLQISPTDFMNGEYIFNEVLGKDGTVINRGLINASLGGNVALIGKQVTNEGVINANLGSAILASGKQAVLTFDDQALIGVRITREILQDELGIDPAVINSGEINAQGGRVLLTASASRDVFSQVVNSGDIKQASSVLVNEDGSFSLSAGANIVNSGNISVDAASLNSDAGDVVIIGENITHTGSITADSNNGAAGNIELHVNDKTELKETALISAQAKTSGVGGNIKLLGDKVGLFDMAEVNASGENGGGEVLIGGDRQGLNEKVRNAEFIYLGEETNVYADAKANGDGGKIITYADDTARIYGGLFSRGGLEAGNGGFIETSGKKSFDILNAPDVSASAGEGGLWLIDPYNITIVNGAALTNVTPVGTEYTSTGTPATLGVDTILTAMSGGTNVEVKTDRNDVGTDAGDINFGDGITPTVLDYSNKGENTLTFWAEGDINFTSQSKIIGDGTTGDLLNVNLFAEGAVVLSDQVEIITQGGNYTVGFDDSLAAIDDFIPTSYSADFGSKIDTSGIINTVVGNSSGGDISITSSGAIITQGLIANAGTATRPGGNNTGISGLNGGNIILKAGTGVTLNGVISATGSRADFDNGNGGETGGLGGTVNISTSSGQIFVQAIDTTGGQGDGDGGDPGNGGIGGSVTLTGQETILNGNIITLGGLPDGGIEGQGGDIIINSAVKLSNSVLLDTNRTTLSAVIDGSVTITGDINNNTAGSALSALTIDSGISTTSIIGDIGNLALGAIESFTITEASSVDVDAIKTMDGGISINSASTIDLGGDIVTTADPTSETAGNLLLTGDLILSANVKLDTNAAPAIVGGVTDTDKNITILGSINADDGVANERTLTIDAGKNSVSLQDIGASAGKQLQGLLVTASTKTTLNGDINTKGGGVDITSTNIDIDSAIINTNLDAAGNGGAATFSGITKLLRDLDINTFTAGTGGNVEFTTTVNADSNGNNIDLSIDAGSGDVIFSGAVGTTQALRSLVVISANDVQLSHLDTRRGGVNISSSSLRLAGNISTIDEGNDPGRVTLNVGTSGIVSLDSDVSITTNGSNNDESINITGDIQSFGGFELTLDAGTGANADIFVNGTVGLLDINDDGAVSGLTILNADEVTLRDGINTENLGVDIQTATLVNLSGDINTAWRNTAGTVSISAPITLVGDTSITTTDNNGGPASDADIQFTNTIDGPFSLSLDAGQANVFLTGAIGSATALTGFSVDSSRETTLGADITTSVGDVSFTGDVLLSGTTRNISTSGNATGGSITFVNTVKGATNLLIDAGAADVSFQQDIGNQDELTSLVVLSANDLNLQRVDVVGDINAVSATGNINLSGDLTVTGSSSGGVINLGGNVVLNQDIILSTIQNGNDGNVDITGFVDSLATAPLGVFYALDIQAGDGAVTLGNDIGATVALGSLNVDTSSDLSIKSVFTNSLNTSGNIRLNTTIATNTITLDGDLDTTAGIVSLAAPTGEIRLIGQVDLLGNSSMNTDSIVSIADGQVVVNQAVNGAFDFDVTVGSSAATFRDAISTRSFSLNQGLVSTTTGVVELQEVTTSNGDIDITSNLITLFGSLTSDSSGATGAITLNGNVSVAADVVVDSSLADADININGGASGEPFKLTLLSGAGNTIVNGDMGSATSVLGGFEVDTTGDAFLQSIYVKDQGIHLTANQLTLAGADIKSNLFLGGSSDSITIDGNVLLANNVAIKTNTGTSAGSVITINGTINADNNTTNARTLSLSSGNAVTTVSDDIGLLANGALQNFSVLSASAISLDTVKTASGGIQLTGTNLNLNGDLLSNDDVIAGLIDVSLTGDIVLGADALVSSNSTLSDALIVINANDIVGSDTFSLTIDAGDANATLTTSISDVTDFSVLASNSTSIVGDVNVSATGQLNINADNGISLDGAFSTAAGTMSLNADVDGDKTGGLSLLAGSDLTTTDQNITLTAAALSIVNTATIDSGAAQVAINSTTDLSLGTAFLGLSVDNAALAAISAGSVALLSDGDFYVNGASSTHVTSLEAVNGDVNFVGAASSFDELSVLTGNDVLLNSAVSATNNLSVTALNIDTTNVDLLIPSGSFTSTSANVVLDGNLTGDRTLNLIAQTGDIDIQAASFTNLDSLNIDATNIVYSAVDPVATINDIDILITTAVVTPEFIQTADLTSTLGQISISTNNNLTFDATTILNAATGVNLTSDTGDISAAAVNVSSGDIYVSALQGSILDNNLTDGNFNADLVHLRADLGIGGADEIGTSASVLDVVNNTSGTVSILNSGVVTLAELTNIGDINFTNNADVTINNINADYDVGSLTFDVTNGSVKATGATPDITALNATISVNGAFGEFNRAIILNVKNQVIIASTFSSTGYAPNQPVSILDTSKVRINVLDSIGNVSSQQLIEVESLADLDPAIFTDLRNYDQRDISIRMPRDQMFDDELDSYDQL